MSLQVTTGAATVLHKEGVHPARAQDAQAVVGMQIQPSLLSVASDVYCHTVLDSGFATGQRLLAELVCP